MVGNGVAEREAGTTVDTEGRKSPTVKTEPPADSSKVSQEEMVPRKQMLDAVKAAENRVKTELSSEINQAKAEIEELTNQIDTLAKDDPDKTELVALRRQWKDKLKDLGQRESVVSSKEAEISKYDRDQLIRQVAGEYVTADGQPVDAASFMKAADRLKVNDDEGLRSLAEEKGFKLKAATTETPETQDDEPPPSASGRGGGRDWKAATPEEKLAEGKRREANKPMKIGGK